MTRSQTSASFEAATKADAVNRGNSDEGRFVEPIQDGVNAFEKFADACAAILLIYRVRAVVQLAQISACREARFLRARNNAGGSFGGEIFCCGDKLFEFAEHDGADFVGRGAVQRQFQYAFAPFPAQRFTLEGFHAEAFRSYIELISAS